MSAVLFERMDAQCSRQMTAVSLCFDGMGDSAMAEETANQQPVQARVQSAAEVAGDSDHGRHSRHRGRRERGMWQRTGKVPQLPSGWWRAGTRRLQRIAAQALALWRQGWPYRHTKLIVLNNNSVLSKHERRATGLSISMF